ncbi:MAG: hypothetical protein HHAS10_09500 [Candidatus Altimarinota bacterium]
MRDKQESHFETESLEDSNKTLQEFIAFLRDLVIIFLIVITIRVFVVTPFRINGSSMETSYHDKEYIIVDKFSYLNTPVVYKEPSTSAGTVEKLLYNFLSILPIHVGDPVRGDVVVITPHVDRKKEYYIKRVIAAPGDTIRFEDGEVLIKTPNSEKFIKISEKYLSSANAGQTRLPENVKTNEFTIPEGYYWVMGDNRNNSADSRSCFKICLNDDSKSHFIKRKDIVGKVLLNLGYYNIFGVDGLIDSKKWRWTYPPRFLSHPRNASYPELSE